MTAPDSATAVPFGQRIEQRRGFTAQSGAAPEGIRDRRPPLTERRKNDVPKIIPIQVRVAIGRILDPGKPVAAGIKVQVTKPGNKTILDTAVTDKFGSYKLMIKEEGKVTLTVIYQGKPLELAVFSNKEATRYDLVVEKKDGKLSVRRK